MNRLRNRLIGIFLAATLVPLAATLWITTSLLDRSLSYASTGELDRLSRSLQKTGKELYQRACDALKNDALGGRVEPLRYGAGRQGGWPAPVKTFFDSGDAERFVISGSGGDRIEYLARRGDEVWQWSTSLGGVGLDDLSREIRSAREIVEKRQSRDLLRGFTYTYVLLAASVWIASLVLLVYLAHRISRPIQQLTAGLAQLAAGDLATRVEARRDDEVGRAMRAFNDMAERLQRSTERLVYLTQLASWRTLARKMAHEVKNSLTPIRLTMEEIISRGPDQDGAFLEQASQIVADEVQTLEKRIRAFSQFAAEPPVEPREVDVNALVEERVSFLKSSYPEVIYNLSLAPGSPTAVADPDLIKGVLTNLLQNAAEAARPGGVVLARTALAGSKLNIEVHDSGPGLSSQARSSLFEPTISFKKGGMGLGLSIARRSALLCGGDLQTLEGELGGAAFRVTLVAHQ